MWLKSQNKPGTFLIGSVPDESMLWGADGRDSRGLDRADDGLLNDKGTDQKNYTQDQTFTSYITTNLTDKFVENWNQVRRKLISSKHLQFWSGTTETQQKHFFSYYFLPCFLSSSTQFWRNDTRHHRHVEISSDNPYRPSNFLQGLGTSSKPLLICTKTMCSKTNTTKALGTNDFHF